MRELAVTGGLVLVLLVGFSAGAPGAALGAKTTTPSTAPCEDPTFVESQGLSCPTSEGAWLVHVGDGAWMRTHGPDPVPGSGDASPDSRLADRADPIQPTCVGSPYTEFHIQVIYAYSTFEEDRYDAFLDDIRASVAEANGMLRQAAAEVVPDAFRSLKVACNEALDVRVEKLELSTERDETTFSTVVSDAVDEGYTDIQTKYWIFIDPNSESSPWGGFSSLPHDSSDTLNNRNNFGQTYSLSLGLFQGGLWLHELTHAMGGVQADAPNFYDNFGGWHCDDNWDVMCYGPEAYTRCSDEHLDCGHDDYFHPDPPPGTYLDNHWNVASEKNRFMVHAPCEGSYQVTASEHSETCLAAADTGDASADGLAVSGTGDAEGTFAVSGTGTADGVLAASGTNTCGDGSACVDAGTSRAQASTLAVSPGDSDAAIAVSGTGTSRGDLAAVSALGPATGTNALSGGGNADGARAVSGDGDATSCYSILNCLAVSGTGAAEGEHAVSGTGPAHAYTLAASGTGDATFASHWTCTPLVCFQTSASASGTGNAEGLLLALSGTGDADSGYLAASAAGDANGECIAVSGTGSAQASCTLLGWALEVSLCETARDQAGTEAACQDLDPGLPS